MSLPVCPSAFIRLAVAWRNGPCGAARTWCHWRGMTPSGGRFAPLALFAPAKQVSFLNIRDPQEPVHSPQNSPGRTVRFPSVTGESEFSSI
jgi:hypothetical protein